MRRRSLRRSLLALSVVLALVGLWAAPGRAADQQQVAAVERQAYFTRPASAAAPPLLLDGFPPSTACLVAGLAGFPQACGEDIADVSDQLGLGDGLPVPVTPDSQVVQPVAPDTLPIGMAAGEERYSSLLQFPLPDLPEGQEFAKIELLMRPDGVSYAAESPAFRELVLAAISQVSDQDPEQFTNVLADVASGETAAVAEAITGIEACPVTETWNGGDAQDAGADGQRVPEVDCLIGTTGEFDPSNGNWVFDITFAAQAWTTGGISGEPIPNEGILLRPLGAENLAYGDPDLSTNWLVSLADGEAADEDLRPRLRYSVAPAPPPVEPIDTAVASPEPAAPVASPTPTPSASPAPSPSSGSSGSQTQTVIPSELRARYAEPAAVTTAATNPWWLLLLIPLLGMIGWSMGEAALARPATATSRQGGALDRLVRTSTDDQGVRS